LKPVSHAEVKIVNLRKTKRKTFYVGLVVILPDDFEGPMLDILLNCRIVHLAANKPLRIKNRVVRIHCSLVLCCISDQSLGFCECNPGWGGAVPLIIGDDLYTIVLPESDTGICGAEVDADRRTVDFLYTIESISGHSP
jgi:hypothetical protein